MTAPAIVWFRQDLRLADQPALAAALAEGGPVLPVYIHAPEEEGGWPPGAAARWWLHGALADLDALLRRLGSRLILLQGPSAPVLLDLARSSGARAVHWNRRYEPAAVAQGAAVAAGLLGAGIAVGQHAAGLLVEPWELSNQQGRPFQVFTPFWKALQQRLPLAPALAAPSRLPPPPAVAPAGLPLASLDLLHPRRPWQDGLAAHWRPTESAAQDRLDAFVAGALAAYPQDRDRPDVDGSARLSPYLHWGQLSARQVWWALREAVAARPERAEAATAFLRQLAWRDFGHHLLHHFPHTALEPLRPDFARFPWAEDPAGLAAWQSGRTGVPLVDAAMRQLWATGWVHNRARMVAASFLVKQLRLPWQEGARWFWDTLVDADLANNSLGWQWVAGSGADAAPYFRIFNPVRQGERFDPDAAYVKRWLPELAGLPPEAVHAPWTLDPAAAPDYPPPIVDLDASRAAALAAYEAMRRGG